MPRGKPLSSLENIVQDADVCFISSSFAAGAASVAQTMQAIKKYNPQARILVGGRDAQYRFEWYLQNGADAVFLGQAEGLIGKVTKALVNNVKISFPGVATCTDIGTLGETMVINHSLLESAGVSSLNKWSKTISRNASLDQEVLPKFDQNILTLYSESCDGLLPRGVIKPLMWYFTSVGCPRSCEFCPTARNPYFSLSESRVNRLLNHYKISGIKTLLSAEDNFLARFLDKSRSEPEIEQEIVGIMKSIRSNGFAVEFSNALDIGFLQDNKGNLRDNLITNLFAYDKTEKGFVGTYRMFWPIETLIERTRFKKLVKKEDNYRILDAVLQTGIPEIIFSLILLPDSEPKDIGRFRLELDEFCNWMATHQRQTKWSIPIFHELPLPGSPFYEKLLPLSFDINTHPELWTVYTNPVNGTHYRYDELYTIKRKLMEEFDPASLAAWDTVGRYNPTSRRS